MSESTTDITPQNIDTIGQNIVPLPARRGGTYVFFFFSVILKKTCLIFACDSDQELAGTVVYLASRAGGYVHGQEIVIDGGYTAVNP